MKTLTISSIALLASVFVSAQSDSTMFGLSRGITTPSIISSGYIRLGKANPSTGVVTNISTSSQGSAFFAVNQCIDLRRKIYYFIEGPGNGTLTGMDLSTGGASVSVPVSISSGAHFNLMSYHCPDSTIYGIANGIVTSSNPATGYAYLAKMDVATGSVTNISAASVATAIVIGRSAIDSKNNIFYFVNGSKHIVGLDLATGTVVSSQQIAVTTASNIADLVYNRLDSTIYCLAYGITTPSNPSSGFVYLARINPSTGIVTNISAASISTNYQTGNVEIDPYNNRFYMIAGNNQLISVSLQTGTVQSSASLSFTAGQYFDGMRYSNRVCTHQTGSILMLPMIVSAPTAIREYGRSDGFSIFPNPASGEVNITLDPVLFRSLRLMDITGRCVFKKSVESAGQTLDLAGLDAGIYLLVAEGPKQVVTKQVMIR